MSIEVKTKDGMKMDVKVEYNDIFDSATRIQMVMPLAQQLGLSDEDVFLLAYVILGNTPTDKEPSLPDILKKIQLPKVKGQYDKEKLARYLKYIGNELKAFDQYGILRMDTKTLIKFSQNHKYLTVYGFNVLVPTYKNLVRLLTENPDYVISVLLGIHESLGTILDFLNVKKA